jgi:hypothetical protein
VLPLRRTCGHGKIRFKNSITSSQVAYLAISARKWHAINPVVR